MESAISKSNKYVNYCNFWKKFILNSRQLSKTKRLYLYIFCLLVFFILYFFFN